MIVIVNCPYIAHNSDFSTDIIVKFPAMLIDKIYKICIRITYMHHTIDIDIDVFLLELDENLDTASVFVT
jgi:hypothetical protein